MSVRLHFLLTCVALSSTGQAGVVLESVETKVATGASQSREVQYIQDGALRIENGTARRIDNVQIFRDGNFYDLDPKARTYTVANVASAKSKRAAMEAQIGRMPIEKRAAMQQVLGLASTLKVNFEYTKTDGTEISGSYTCTVWRESTGKTLSREFCVVPASALPEGAQIVRVYHDLSVSLGRILAVMATTAPVYPDLSVMNGVPVLTRDFVAGAVATETRVVSVQSKPLGVEFFAVPGNFKLAMDDSDSDE